jgi:hypothetical protein
MLVRFVKWRAAMDAGEDCFAALRCSERPLLCGATLAFAFKGHVPIVVAIIGMMPHFSSIWSEAVLMDNDKIVEKHAAQCGASETWERWLWGVIVVFVFHR